MKKLINILSIFGLFTLLSACDSASDSAANLAPSTQGQGGSLARFTISGDHLYMVTEETLTAVDITEAWQPGELLQIGTVRNDVETIFPYQGHLFMGARSGMYIYNIEQPLAPQFVSAYEHITACDPVVVQGDYAYVTLRAGSECGNPFVNILDVIDITNLQNPRRVSELPLNNPFGLGIYGDDLFVCDGDFGLIQFNTSNSPELQELQRYPEINALDVIVRPNHLILTGRDGIFQYTFQPSEPLELLSHIPATPLQ